MTNTTDDLKSRRSTRSQSAIPRYHEYLKKLQEKNRLLKEYKSKENNLKQRESGFHLYANGANLPPRRPTSAMKSPSDRTLSPFFSDLKSATLSNTIQRSNSRRRQWTPATKTNIDQISIPNNQSKHTTKSTWSNKVIELDANQIKANGQMTYRLITPVNVDESWMPNWYRNTKSQDNSDDEHQLSNRLSLSLDDIPITAGLTKSQQQTYRLSTTVGR